jgi:hypothetical protein
MSSRGASLFGCLSLVAASACGSVPRVGEAGPTVPVASAEKEYERTLERYTDHEEIYDLFNTRLFTAITYQSWPFREARVQRLAIFQVQPKELVERNLAAERAAFESFHEFFFGVHAASYRFDDFDRRNSIWRIALVTEAGETTPISVERIGRSDLNLRAIYPYLDEFWVAYRIRFARITPTGAPVIPPGSGRFMLRLASTLGRAEFHFPAE